MTYLDVPRERLTESVRYTFGLHGQRNRAPVVSATENVRARRMVLLAPVSSDPTCEDSAPGGANYRRLLCEAQRLRAAVYIRDGAIQPYQMSADGRFIQSGDEDSWHMLVLASDGAVRGCARYRPYKPGTRFEDLGVFRSALAADKYWGPKLRSAVETMMNSARQRDLGFVECGGWALAEEIRCSTEAVRIALGMYALARRFSGVLGLTTATKRHHSSAILRRIGGHALRADGIELPCYYDPQYGCEMEILGFDSSAPNPKFEQQIRECEIMLSEASVVYPASAGAEIGVYFGADAGKRMTTRRAQSFTYDLLALAEFAQSG